MENDTPNKIKISKEIIATLPIETFPGKIVVIDNEKDGFIIKDRNIDEMANKIVAILNQLPKEISENAIKKAQQFSYQNVKQQWIETFKNFNIHDLKTRVIFTSSAGGHFSELCELKELMERYNSFLITEDHEMMQDYKKKNK